MGDTAKSSITSWWILALMALFLWYRNIKYDRALSLFVFTLGITQLFEYGIYSGTDPHNSGRVIYITLWLQCLVLAISVYILIKSTIDNESATLSENIICTIAGWNMFLFAIIFIIALVMAFISDDMFSAEPDENSGFLYWTINNNNMLSRWGWLYILGLLIPLILLFGFYSWADLGLAILIIYGALSGVYVLIKYGPDLFGPVWQYLAVGFAFLAWTIGIIPR